MKLPNTTILFREVNASSLGILRLLFGFILLEDFVNFHSYFYSYLEPSEFYNTYEFFHWVKMMPKYLLDIFFYGAITSCLLFALGIHYRLNACITFFSWTYIFLVDKGHYNNHFYLVTIILFLFCIVGGDRWGALSKNKKTTVPYWHVLIFRWQIAIVYFYGGIAKIHGDWMNGFPMRYWLEAISNKYPEFIQPIFHTNWMALAFSWSGLVFDLFVPFLLLSKKWRYWTIFPVVAFHTINDFTWEIGDFPTIMLASTPIFFASNWADVFYKKYAANKLLISAILGGAILAIIHGYFIQEDLFKSTNFYIKLCSYPILLYLFLSRNKEKDTAIDLEPVFLKQKKSSLFLLIAWFSFQLLFPFRHWLYQGHPSWTGEGHLFAWRMMLVDSVDAWRMKVIVPETGEELPIALNQYVNYRQYRKMRRTPKSFLRFAHHIKEKVEANGVKNPIIKMEIWKSVNNRAPRLLNDTTLNYATVPYMDMTPVTWMTDWNESIEKPTYSTDVYARWRDFLEKEEQDNNYSWR